MQARLERLTGDPAAATLKLVHGGDRLLPGHNDRVRRLLAGELEARGIEAIAGTRVIEVRRDRVVCAEGREFEADHIFWVANVTPPTWLGASGLRVDEAGFIAVAGTLQSLSHAHVFAAGDVAAVVNEARPKSGVFAVRAARPLVGNLRRFFAGRPLEPWAPQREFLSLIGTGRAEAVASRRFLAAKGRSMWWLKDWIDRRFMRRFEQLPEMGHTVSDLSSRQETPFPVPGRESPAELSRRADRRCLGCAAKIGASSLARVLERVRMDSDLSIVPRDEFLVGLEAAEDAAVFLPPPGRALVQTVDYLPALLSDLHLFGRIAALHCFSDIFAMGAEPHSALIAALVPFGADALREESLYQLISGAARELDGMGAVMMGGHSAENPLPGLSITANGLVDPTSILRKGSLVPGQVLVLTKPLGIGMIFAAHMRLEAGRACLDAAIESMLVSNLPASRLLRAHRASAATDVTGFGLLGHLLEMLRPSGARVLLELDALPAVRGALDCASRGHRSSLHDDNRRAEAFLADRGAAHSHPRLPLLYDPQTSGGLLAALPSHEADGCVAALRALRMSGRPHHRESHRHRSIRAGHRPANRLIVGCFPSAPVQTRSDQWIR